MNCRFWKLEIAPLLSHLERLIKRWKHSTKKSLRVCGDGWCVVWEEEIIIKKNSISLSQSTLLAKTIFKFSCLEILTNGRSPLCWLFRHSKKAFSLPSASNDHMPSSLKGRRMSLFTVDPLSVSLETSWGSQGGLRAVGWYWAGAGTQQAGQAARRAACLPHNTAGEESLDQNLKQGQSERKIT